MKNWLVRYKEIVNLRYRMGEIKGKTLQDYNRLINFCSETWPDRQLSDITPVEITDVIHSYAEHAPHTARRLRINLANLYLEAQRHCYVPLGHNPALLSRWPETTVSADRIELAEWLRIFRCAQYRAPEYFQNAMLLALVSAQRPSDLVKMQASDIRDGYLHITQFKTGAKIALPLSLKLDAISTSLEEITETFRPYGRFLQNRNGKNVNTWSLSRWFKICREDAGINPQPGRTLPPFREQRSLAERLYRAQGIDTQTLLGHKYQQMTNGYNDLRGKAYKKLIIN